ncbi:cytochrome P450 [Streptomyces ziwulingensis]|uniref:Cytochrome P450 n=1 Tax=Streptomyces ziwulingensis TaxID=1045501 RepID=A0ABP9CTF0_9ACTN
MTDASPHVTELPIERPDGCPFAPPPKFRELNDQHPISRMSYPDGHRGWLVTGHALAREVLADRRFSSRRELMHIPFPGMGDVKLSPATPGLFTAMDPPEHSRYRKLLAGKFTVRRMNLLAARIEGITTRCLDAMEAAGPPVDLVQAFAFPLPALTICELLGVPGEDHGLFQQEVLTTNSLDASEEEVMAAMTALQEHMRGLIAAKRAEPTDDVLSDLVGSDLSDEEIEGIGAVLLAAGLDTTANMLALGVYALLRNPAQWDALRADPALADRAVEELLRYLSVVDIAVKAATADVELGGHRIEAGDSVTLALHAANRDPRRFDAPDSLDLRRIATGHLAFGHGIHQCLGQQLARVEMQVAYRALITRFPTLRLAVPPEEVLPRTGIVRGVQQLPVAWDRA